MKIRPQLLGIVLLHMLTENLRFLVYSGCVGSIFLHIKKICHPKLNKQPLEIKSAGSMLIPCMHSEKKGLSPMHGELATNKRLEAL